MVSVGGYPADVAVDERTSTVYVVELRRRVERRRVGDDADSCNAGNDAGRAQVETLNVPGPTPWCRGRSCDWHRDVTTITTGGRI